MNTITTAKTNLVTLFSAFRPSLSYWTLKVRVDVNLFILEILDAVDLQREMSMMMYMTTMAVTGTAKDVRKNPI